MPLTVACTPSSARPHSTLVGHTCWDWDPLAQSGSVCEINQKEPSGPTDRVLPQFGLSRKWSSLQRKHRRAQGEGTAVQVPRMWQDICRFCTYHKSLPRRSIWPTIADVGFAEHLPLRLASPIIFGLFGGCCLVGSLRRPGNHPGGEGGLRMGSDRLWLSGVRDNDYVWSYPQLLCWHDFADPTPGQLRASACSPPLFDKSTATGGCSCASTGLTSHLAFLRSSAIAWAEQAAFWCCWEWCKQSQPRLLFSVRLELVQTKADLACILREHPPMAN